jgi:hypothetical protein
MLARIITWVFFGLALSLTPLVIVAALGWTVADGFSGFLRVLFQEDMLAVALALGGAAVANVLASGPSLKPLKLACGGLTFLMTVWSVAAYVVIKAHAKPLTSDEVNLLVSCLSGATLATGFASEILAEF